MSNKGQSLVVFVILLPLFIILLALVADSGNILITKQKYENEIKETITYGLNNLENENTLNKMQTLLKANIDGNVNITLENKTINISVKTTIPSIFYHQSAEFNLNYLGYLDQNQIIIKKI